MSKEIIVDQMLSAIGGPISSLETSVRAEFADKLKVAVLPSSDLGPEQRRSVFGPHSLDEVNSYILKRKLRF